MEDLLSESIFLYDNLLTTNQKLEINNFLNHLKQNKPYNYELLWLLDQEIGGIGGYCMHGNPVINHFPSGEKRRLYRPLQYARNSIEFITIYFSSRNIIQNCGMHLETVLRIYALHNNFFGHLTNFNSTLGKMVNNLQKKKIYDDLFFECLFSLVKLYNNSKHEVNMDDEREKLFSYGDAIIVYFSARMLSQQLLNDINYEYSLSKYEINLSSMI